MQVSPSPSQRQLISGKVGCGWREATYPISANFGFAGFLMITVAIVQVAIINEQSLYLLTNILALIGFWIGIFSSHSVTKVCRQNSDYQFSQSQLIAITAYWLVLIAGLSNSSEYIAKNLVAIWWVLPAAIFIGISISLTWQSRKVKTNQQQPELFNSDTLSIITYSDQTVLISPSAVGQQPRQFNSLVLIVMGFFVWTMLDFSTGFRSIASISLASAGLTGFFTWQAQLRVSEKILHLKFSGLWGIASEYAISLRPFSSLSVVKLREAGGEISWMQLSGSNSEITMPLAMTIFQSEPKEGEIQNDPLGESIREKFRLAKQETERDSLELANVLLPQGSGILAGSLFILLGGLLLLIFPLPTKLAAESAIGWLGVYFASPEIARFFLQLVAPNTIQSDRSNYTKPHLQAWEIGKAILLISSFVAAQTTRKVISLDTLNQTLPLITLICGWLSISIGVCILAFVRRSPIWNVNQ